MTAISIAAPVNFLMASGYKNLKFEDIDLDHLGQSRINRTVVLDTPYSWTRPNLKAGEFVKMSTFLAGR